MQEYCFVAHFYCTRQKQCYMTNPRDAWNSLGSHVLGKAKMKRIFFKPLL